MKKTRFIIALVAAMFAVGAMLFVACNKDENQPMEISKKAPKGILYYCHWTSKDGNDLLVEFRIDGKDVTEVLIDGKPSSLLERKIVHVHNYPGDALTEFDECMQLGYECVRIDKVEISGPSNITGDHQPKTLWLVTYGHCDENGDCDWVALDSSY